MIAQNESGVPVPVSVWVSGSWSIPKTYHNLSQLIEESGAMGAGYGPEGQYWELQGMLIGPPIHMYKKILYAWVDENKRLQIANSIQEAKELMI